MKKEQKLLYNKDAQDQFFTLLRTEASEIVKTAPFRYKSEIILKAFLFPVLYFACWVSAMIYGVTIPVALFSGYFAMGLLLVLNYLNVVHDAAHNTIFKNRRFNELYVYMFDIMGANSFIWKTRHILFHHNYPNVNGWDTDIDQSTLVKIVPQAPFAKLHKYQHIYLPFIYPLFLFNWLLVRDFTDFFNKQRIVHKRIHIPFIEYIKLFFFKGLFFTYIILLPIFIFHIAWKKVLLAFIIMLFTASISALIVLLPPHANTSADFPRPDKEKKLPYGWLMHMLKTTNDVHGENWFTRFVLGNFNYHIVHHLFPNIHHIFYPQITEKLKHLSGKNNLPYRSYSLGKSLKMHFLLLKKNSVDFNIWEEDM
ncbi:MAG: fatty acid desaturase [Chitinophagaceae bacterium]|nr:fatty acid desaturase [Chitinophagaceae bacterium]